MSDSKPKTRKPLSRNAKRWIKVAIAAVFAIIIVTLVSINVPKDTHTAKPTPTPSATVTPLPTKTDTEKETVATTTVNVIGQQIANSIKTQVGEAGIANIKIGDSYAETDPSGKAAKVAILTFSNIPSKFDYNQANKAVINYLAKINDDQKGYTDWFYTKATDADIEGSDTVAALKAWDKAEKPENPAIIEVSYHKTGDTYEVVVSATVY